MSEANEKRRDAKFPTSNNVAKPKTTPPANQGQRTKEQNNQLNKKVVFQPTPSECLDQIKYTPTFGPLWVRRPCKEVKASSEGEVSKIKLGLQAKERLTHASRKLKELSRFPKKKKSK